jgi:hypothetical protein
MNIILRVAVKKSLKKQVHMQGLPKTYSFFILMEIFNRVLDSRHLR